MMISREMEANPDLFIFAGHDFILYTGLIFTEFTIWLINKTVYGLYGPGGAALSLNPGAYVPNMTAGRGWIALVAIYLGRKHPAGIFVTCLIFAGADYFSNTAQGLFHIPFDFLLGFLYIITFIGMIIFSIINTKSET